MIHLIVHTDKDMRVKDWTPFENVYKSDVNLRIINEKDLITHALNKLSENGWVLKTVFTQSKEQHFLCIKKTSTREKIKNNSKKYLVKKNNEASYYDTPPLYQTSDNLQEDSNYSHPINSNYDFNDNQNNTYLTLESQSSSSIIDADYTTIQSDNKSVMELNSNKN